MPSFVLLTDDAAHDLEGIHDYIARHDSISRANHVLERIEKVFASLSESPQYARSGRIGLLRLKLP